MVTWFKARHGSKTFLGWFGSFHNSVPTILRYITHTHTRTHRICCCLYNILIIKMQNQDFNHQMSQNLLNEAGLKHVSWRKICSHLTSCLPHLRWNPWMCFPGLHTLYPWILFQGYLFISVLVGGTSDLMKLVIQSIKNDLASRNPVHVNLAMQCIANIGSREMAESFGGEIPKLLVSGWGRFLQSVVRSGFMAIIEVLMI